MTTEFIQIVFMSSNLSQKDFADKINVSPSTVRNWINGLYAPDFVNQKAIRAVFKYEVMTAQIKTFEL